MLVNSGTCTRLDDYNCAGDQEQPILLQEHEPSLILSDDLPDDIEDFSFVCQHHAGTPVSSLRSYDGYPHLLSHIVPGRPVDCVCLVLMVVIVSKDGVQPDHFAIHTDFVSTVRDISRSAVPVRRLVIEYLLPTFGNLTAIANYLPDLHRLDLGLISGPPLLIPVSV